MWSKNSNQYIPAVAFVSKTVTSTSVFAACVSENSYLYICDTAYGSKNSSLYIPAVAYVSKTVIYISVF